MKKRFPLCFSLLIVSACSKFKVPEFSAATIAINESNVDMILNARFHNASAQDNSFSWYKDYAIDFPDSVEENYTSYCETGEIYGNIEKDIIRSDRNFLLVDMKFDECLFSSSADLITINGNIDLDSTFYSSSDDYFSITQGNYKITTFNTQFVFSQHYYEIDYTEKSDEVIIKEYSKIEIKVNNKSIGTVNFYTDTPYEALAQSIEGEDIIEGANKSKIRIKYSTKDTKVYLNNSLYATYTNN
ncbi:hypothetical protein [Marinicellulosiphila megalodicopiae]|uniref:hypothetical protein n=1 Tax=Marinicellulosiphila megalodicopiae TaxID=2724896 RepID=UPI003BAE1E50